jgi:ABC-type histidine transport system ATPase subunit
MNPAREGTAMVAATREMGFARRTADSVVVQSGQVEQIFAAARADRRRRLLSQVLCETSRGHRSNPVTAGS